MEKRAIRQSASLIERAAQMYDFGHLAAKPSIQPEPSLARPTAHRAAFVRQRVEINTTMLREAGFILPDAAPSMLSEEFRLVKRQLLLAAFGGRKSKPVERGRSILVSSAQPNEGKTFCAVNLALSMAAEAEIEVLLVDADVAKPEVLSTLGIAGQAGLLDLLADPALDPESLILETSIPNLLVLPAGRHSNNDTELLASDRTLGLIDGLMVQNPRRVVVFDTAPALAASAASVLANSVGQVLCVVRADRTTDAELREAVSLLSGCPHLQLMLNGVTYTGNNQKFGSYYGYGG